MVNDREVLAISLGIISGRITPCKLTMFQQGALMNAWGVDQDPFFSDRIDQMQKLAEEYVASRILHLELLTGKSQA